MCKFLIDSGDIYSVFPQNIIYHSLFLSAPIPLLNTVGGGILQYCGTIKRDIGFTRLFRSEFSVTNIDYGILGIDFLRKYHPQLMCQTTSLLPPSTLSVVNGT